MSDLPRGALPTLVSLLVCDQVIDDRLTNKKSAIGMFNMIIVPHIPAQVPHIAVLASLTEISSRAELEIRLARDADDTVLFSGRGAVEAPNPLAVVDLVFTMQRLQFPAAGQYAFELWAGGEMLGRRRFQVLQPPPRPVPPGGPHEGEPRS
ncbi:MAG: hypothetical protein AB7Q17_04925 [Phycisphaerae bacterium]